jgi:hypothetical protein
MVKQALISTIAFEMTVDCLQKPRNGFLLSPEFEELIAAQCGFKASIVANDERESTSRTDQNRGACSILDTQRRTRSRRSRTIACFGTARLLGMEC